MMSALAATQPAVSTTVLARMHGDTRGLGPWFDMDPQALFALDLGGRVIAANQAAQDFISEGRVGVRAPGVLNFGTAASDCALHHGVVAAPKARESVHRLILRYKDGRWGAADLHAMAKPELVILALHASAPCPSRDSLQAIASAFQLTRTEAAILERLCAGDCPKAAARQLKMSEHTVRAHLRSIYAKMGARGLTNTVVMATQLLG